MTELDKDALEEARKALYAAWSDGDYDEALGLAAVAIRAYLDNASISKGVTPHTLRHTATTWLLQAGVEVWQVAGFLGMTADMVERNYGHHSPLYQKQAADAVTKRRA